MTRDEAIKADLEFIRREAVALRSNCPDDVLRNLAAINVDRGVAFGILKLDEPKIAAPDKIKALARDLSNVASGCTCFDCLTKTLDRHSLKIVEK